MVSLDLIKGLRTVQETSLSVHPLVLPHGPDLEADEPRPGLGHQPQPLHSPVPGLGDLHCAVTAGLGQVRDVPQVGEVILENDLEVQFEMRPRHCLNQGELEGGRKRLQHKFKSQI